MEKKRKGKEKKRKGNERKEKKKGEKKNKTRKRRGMWRRGEKRKGVGDMSTHCKAGECQCLMIRSKLKVKWDTQASIK